MGEPIRLFKDPKGKDGGSSSEPCLQVRTRVSGSDETVIAVTAAEVGQLTARAYESELRWSGASVTRVHLAFSDVTIYSVESHHNPDYDASDGTGSCRDHALLEATLELSTEDGKLMERVEGLRLVAYDSWEAHGSFSIDKPALQGSYVGTARPGQCLEQVAVRVLVAGDGAHGTLGDRVVHRNCEDEREAPTSEYAAGNWGSRWVNYGD